MFEKDLLRGKRVLITGGATGFAQSFPKIAADCQKQADASATPGK